jgi:hypothetical protein
MLKFLCALCGAILLSTCISSPASVTEPPATREDPAIVEDLLTRDVQEYLAAYPRPQPFQTRPSQEEIESWQYYRQGVAASLSKLFADTRSQSLSVHSLATIFQKGSGLSLATYESPAEFVLVSILDVPPGVRIGGGSSPETQSDALYILNRQGDIWSIGLVAGVVAAVWVEDHWVLLIARTIWGTHINYAVWHVPQGSWDPETKFAFGQMHSVPKPQLSANGQIVTQFYYAQFDCDSATPIPCDLSNGMDNLCSQEMNYRTDLRQGNSGSQYTCEERHIIKERHVIEP